jgi:hypothetical protein
VRDLQLGAGGISCRGCDDQLANALRVDVIEAREIQNQPAFTATKKTGDRASEDTLDRRSKSPVELDDYHPWGLCRCPVCSHCQHLLFPFLQNPIPNECSGIWRKRRPVASLSPAAGRQLARKPTY